MRNNILLEFYPSSKLINRLEKICKNNELFLAEWERQNNKIRILSEINEIKEILHKEFSNDEIKKLSFKSIPFMENLKQ